MHYLMGIFPRQGQAVHNSFVLYPIFSYADDLAGLKQYKCLIFYTVFIEVSLNKNRIIQSIIYLAAEFHFFLQQKSNKHLYSNQTAG